MSTYEAGSRIIEAEVERLRDDALQVVLEALAWLPPESAKQLMAGPAYQRFKAHYDA